MNKHRRDLYISPEIVNHANLQRSGSLIHSNVDFATEGASTLDLVDTNSPARTGRKPRPHLAFSDHVCLADSKHNTPLSDAPDQFRSRDILGEQGSQQGGRDIFITGTLGVGQVVLLQKLQNLWSKREFKNLEQSSSSMFGAGWFSTFKDTERDLHNEVFGYMCVSEDQYQKWFHPRRKPTHFWFSMNLLSVKQDYLVRKVYFRGFSPGPPQKLPGFAFFVQRTREVVSAAAWDAKTLTCAVFASIPRFSWIISKSFQALQSVYDNFGASSNLASRSQCRSTGALRTPLNPAASSGHGKRGASFRQEEGDVLWAERKGQPFRLDFCGDRSVTTMLAEVLQPSSFSRDPAGVPDIPKNPERYDPFMTNEHFQFTNLFLCGLLSQSPKAAPSLEHLVPPLDLKKKRRALKSYLSSSVRIHLRGLPRYPSTDIQGSKVHVMPNFLWILRCIFETHSEDVARLTAKGISADYIKLAYCNIYSADCSSLGVDLDNNNISDYGVKQLFFTGSVFASLLSVRFCVNQLTDSSIEVLSRELIRYKNRQGSGTAGAKLVAQIIEECPHIMTVKKSTTLFMDNDKKMAAGSSLKMWGNSIGDEGAEAFAEALKNHPKLTNLSLSANGISSEGGRSLARALKENSSLHIFWLIQNSISDDAASELQEALRRNTALTHLILIDNKLSARGAQMLAEVNMTVNPVTLNPVT
uniref:Nucleotide binding oligomerization domain containing 1 n=1 Tax=Astyanax mexicanus TaxID=7994 RepID=A0A3B1JSE1_ASTMX